ncbi:transferase [Ancylobacter sp.]|uniref:transferase n=1 Tax=Ancylobacter sp. TaxID=1872567 RepID=UPI003D1289AF
MLQSASVTVTVPAAAKLREADAPRIGYPRREPATVAQMMSQHLDLARPGSDAEALRVLRQAFPSASLAARVDAMKLRAR